MAVDTAAGRYKAPADKAILMRMWADWRGVAPLHAAHLLWLQQATTKTAPKEAARAMFTTAEGLRTALGWAKWFRRWATTFTPPRARDPLIPEGEAVFIETNAPEIEPPLGRLDDLQVRAARAFRQSHPKDFDPAAIIAAWRA